MLVERSIRVMFFENARTRTRMFERQEDALAFASARERVIDPATITLSEFVDEVWLPIRCRGGSVEGRSGKPLARTTRFIYGGTLRRCIFPTLAETRLAELTTELFAAALRQARLHLAASGRSTVAANCELRQAWALVTSICRIGNRLGLIRVSPPDRPLLLTDQERAQLALQASACD